jgi:hypothetical protein
MVSFKGSGYIRFNVQGFKALMVEDPIYPKLAVRPHIRVPGSGLRIPAVARCPITKGLSSFCIPLNGEPFELVADTCNQKIKS